MRHADGAGVVGAVALYVVGAVTPALLMLLHADVHVVGAVTLYVH